jgi:hypothetical protein
MQKIIAVLFVVFGLWLCVWDMISAGVFDNAGEVHLNLRFYLDVAWTLCGVVLLILAFRRRGSGTDAS